VHAHGEKVQSEPPVTKTSDTAQTDSDGLPSVGLMPVSHLNSPGVSTESTPSVDTDGATRPPTPQPVLALAERARQRMALRPGAFTWTYSEEDLIRIHSAGTELQLSDKQITDMIFIGSRKDKPLTATQVVDQMRHWAETVSKRGFPFRFGELALYQRFSNLLLRLVRQAGLPDDDVRIQGSSLRKPEAGDVDIGIFVAQAAFDSALGGAFAGKAKRNDKSPGEGVSAFDARPAANTALPVTGGDHETLVALARDVRANDKLYNAVAKTWAHALLEGIVNSKGQALPKLKEAAKTIQQRYQAQNIETLAMLIKNGSFDLDPSLRVQPVEGVGE
jgi:hypothetical protein